MGSHVVDVEEIIVSLLILKIQTKNNAYMKPTLFVLAAGMGSRYGGLKQLDGLGPNGETIMDYSIYDAIRGGFGKVVFVIRHLFEDDFREKIIKKYAHVIPVELVFQELDYLPAGFTVPEGRVKPWGTNHAVLMGKDVIKEPFAVINADDFYGRDSFAVIATLSESGSVSRGICETDSEGFLTSVVERTQIERRDGQVMYKDGETWVAVDENTPVSMNMWGFTPDYFRHSEDYFIGFLRENAGNIKAEYFIPLMVNYLITNKISTVKVLDTTAKWFGVTYAEDRPSVVAQIRALIDAGEYPEKLF